MRASLIALFVFALDQWSKHQVETSLSLYDSLPVIPGFFSIVRSQNTGVAFGILAGSDSRVRAALLIAFSVTALFALGMLLWRNRNNSVLSSSAIAFIFGGAAGNVFDRVFKGSVTDFLDFAFGNYHWYTFNVADAAITTGAALLLLGMMRRPAAERKAHT